MKQRVIVIVAIVSVTLFSLLLAGCNVAEANPGNLSASLGGDGENGPGSGKWRPNVPRGPRQARALHTVLVQLAEEGTIMSTEYDAKYKECRETEGNQARSLCNNELRLLAVNVTNLILDFDTGETVYDIWASETEGEETPPKPPEGPKKPGEDPPPDTETPDDPEPSPCCWCLTCTHTLNFEYVQLLPAPELVTDPSS